MIIEDRPAEGVLRLRLDRPEARNALNGELRVALAERFDAADRDETVRVLVVAGQERIFAAGADLKVMAKLSPTELHGLGYHRLWQRLADFRKPAIAAVRGLALGAGCELALHCDLIVAGRSAGFGLPEIKVGIMPGAGGTQRLVRTVGKYRALRLLMTGEILPAAEAAGWGLVSHLADDDKVEDEAVAVAAKVAAGPALALEFIKEAVLQGADLPLAAALAIERKSLQLLFDTEDQKEGMAAFAERRPPRFGKAKGA